MSTVSPQGLKPPASGSVDTYVKANLLPGASKVRGRPRPLLLLLGHAPPGHPPVLPCSSLQGPGHQARSSPLLGCAPGDPIREVDQGGALGTEALTHPAGPLGQSAADTHSSGHKGTRLGRNAHLSWLHPPGRWA